MLHDGVPPLANRSPHAVIPQWIRDLSLALKNLPARLQNGFLIDEGASSLLCVMDPPCLFNEDSGEFQLSIAFILGRAIHQIRCICSCYGCEAFRGSNFAARQLGLLNELSFGAKKSDLQQAAEWYGLAAINNYDSAWVDLARVFRNMTENSDQYVLFIEKLEPLFRKSANAGDVDEQINFARFLISTGLDEKVSEGRRLLQSLANDGNAHAIFLLSLQVLDPAESIEMVTKAAHQNYSPAMLRLAKMLDNGVGIKRNMKMAMYWYERASEEREPLAMFRLAQLIHESDPQRALSLFETVVNSASDCNIRSQAQFCLGCAVLDSNREYGIKLLSEAADAGLGSAQAKLGLYFIRTDSSTQNLAKGLQYLKSAVNHGDCDPEATLALGCFFLENDLYSSQGLALVSQASDSGYPPALLLGYHLLKESNLPKALVWLQQAASMGNAEAQVELGLAYEEGLVTGCPDFWQALAFYKKASAQSDARALFQLYLLLGREQDANKVEYGNAVRWLQLSADNGYAPAQARLGKLLLELTEEEKKASGLDNLDCLHYLDGAAESGDTNSACEASKIRLDKDHDIEKALYDLDATAQAGCIPSQMLLIEGYLASVFPNKDKVLFYLNLAVQHDLVAQYLKCAILCNVKEFVKLHLNHDQNIDQDEVNQGLFETKMAAIQGNSHCQFLLGQQYCRGIIVDSDFDEARRWLSLSASQGHSDAASLLAFLSSGLQADHWDRIAITSGSSGKIFTERLQFKHQKELVEFLHKAAELGNQFAMLLFADYCENPTEKLCLMEKAANFGIPKAQRWLARSLQDKNHATTWADWLERAAEGGDLEAQREMAAWKMHPRHGIFVKRINRRESKSPFCINDFVVDSTLSLPDLTALAQSGNHRAQYCLGLHFFKNLTHRPFCKADAIQARRWLRRSSRAGNACAQVVMALLYLDGTGNSKSCPPRAYSLLIEASECGYNEAFYLLALKFSRDLDESLQYLERAALLGHQMALCQYVSQMSGLGKTISSDIIHMLQEIADRNIEACYQLCRMGRKSPRECIKLLKQSTLSSHSRAQVLLGDIVSSDACAVSSNPGLAESCYYRAAMANNHIGQVRLAKIFDAKAQHDKAFFFFEQACAQGNLTALEWLSMRPFRSVSFQIKDAVQLLISSDAPPFVFFLASLLEADSFLQRRYLERSAERGHAMAQYYLGRTLVKTGDIRSAIIWLKSAADQGNVSSCLDLALCLLTGDESVCDWTVARKYLIQAVFTGSSRAAVLLSTLYTIVSFKCPVSSCWSISHALLWSATAKQLDANFDYTPLAFSVDVYLREQINRYLKEASMKSQLAVLEVIHSKLPLAAEVRQSLAKLILEMCGVFQYPSDFDSNFFAEMHKLSVVHPDVAISSDEKKLVPRAIQYFFGDCVATDIRMASRFLQNAAGRGAASAQVLVGFLYELGGLGVCEQPWQALSSFWYSKSALAGSAMGCFAYAEFFERKSCWTSAAFFYHRAVELGSSVARLRLPHLLDANSDLQDAVHDVIRTAQSERSFVLLSGCYSKLSPVSLLEKIPSSVGNHLNKSGIFRTILEFVGASQLVWYPEPEVSFTEFIRLQSMDPDSEKF